MHVLLRHGTTSSRNWSMGLLAKVNTYASYCRREALFFAVGSKQETKVRDNSRLLMPAHSLTYLLTMALGVFR